MSSGVSSWVTNGLEGAQVGSVPVVFWTARRPGCSLPSYVSAKLLLEGASELLCQTDTSATAARVMLPLENGYSETLGSFPS